MHMPGIKAGIMQPYLFPYIGYFQLIHCVDRFVIYDDVNYIKQGWINRNRILVNGKAHLFTLPLQNASSFTRIHELSYGGAVYIQWRNKFLRTLEQAYRRAPYRDDILAMVSSVFHFEGGMCIDLLESGLRKVCERIGVKTEMVKSSMHQNDQHLSGQERVIDIVLKEGAVHYVNAIGGMDLYQNADFKRYGLKLSFLRSLAMEYGQPEEMRVANLSILDVMMWNAPSVIQHMLEQYELVDGNEI